jgi:hypothetical protein
MATRDDFQAMVEELEMYDKQKQDQLALSPIDFVISTPDNMNSPAEAISDLVSPSIQVPSDEVRIIIP